MHLNSSNQQQDIIKTNDKLHQLKMLIAEYKHAEKLLEKENEILTILNEQYTAELSKIRPSLPESLMEKISTLLKKDLSTSHIIKQVRDNIPGDIPAWVLVDFS